MLGALKEAAAKSSDRIEVERSIQDMAASFGSEGFGHTYRAFMSLLADHIQVYGPILAPYLPALAKMVT
jgi:hypothetical protein